MKTGGAVQKPAQRSRAYPKPAPPILFPSSTEYTALLQHKRDSPSLRQTRICGFFNYDCTHGSSFLDLPYQVRRKIYDEASIATGCLVYLYQGVDPEGYRPWTHSDDSDRKLHDKKPVDFDITLKLLLTCRQLYRELASIIYSENKFFFRHWDPWDVLNLENLSTVSLSSLRYLSITFFQTGDCTHYRTMPCCNNYSSRTDSWYSFYGSEVECSRENARSAALIGPDLVAIITTHMEPSQLYLQFTCDVNEYQSAATVVKPFQQIRNLKRFAIRLSSKPDSKIRELAIQTALQVLRPSDEKSETFPFLRLPREVRLEILRYTDLVVPLKEVYWSPKGFNVLTYPYIVVNDILTKSEYEYFHGGTIRDCWHFDDHGCYCSKHHGSYSSSCHCWSPPTPLFLVCRALLEDARAVFFSQNRFIVVPERPLSSTSASPDRGRLDASLFIRFVPEIALQYLRFLELVFPFYQDSRRLPNSNAHKDWENALEFAKRKLNLPQLTLRVYAMGPRKLSPHEMSFQDVFDDNRKLYAVLFKPLSKLRGLKMFYSDIFWHYNFSRWEQREGPPPFPPKYQKAKLDREIGRKWVVGRKYNTLLGRNICRSSKHWQQTYVWDEELVESGWLRYYYLRNFGVMF